MWQSVLLQNLCLIRYRGLWAVVQEERQAYRLIYLQNVSQVGLFDRKLDIDGICML